MKKFLYPILAMNLFAACSSDEDEVFSSNEKCEPAQMVEVCIGMKDIGDHLIGPNIIRVPFNPIPDEEWPATLLDNRLNHYYVFDASVCRIQTDKGTFYHACSAYDNNLGGYFYTGDGLHLYYYDEDMKCHRQRQEVPEGFPCIEGWECIYYNRWEK